MSQGGGAPRAPEDDQDLAVETLEDLAAEDGVAVKGGGVSHQGEECYTRQSL